jgi:ribosomal protein S18 acetylase RimI-like enzyme
VTDLRIRPTGVTDLETLRALEWASGQRFRDYGLDQVADDEPAPIEVLARYANAGRSWVVVGEEDKPVGYVLVDEIDGAAHIEQVSVAPEYQGRGLGRALIDQVRFWAVDRGMPAITLTTFGHIPWNQPLYEHLGFRVLSHHELGPGLLEVWERESAHGLDPALRVVMRLEL